MTRKQSTKPPVVEARIPTASDLNLSYFVNGYDPVARGCEVNKDEPVALCVAGLHPCASDKVCAICERDEQPVWREMQRVCNEIAQDMADDAAAFDGKPFNGRTVAEYFGNQGAAIASLAGMLSVVMEAVQRTREE